MKKKIITVALVLSSVCAMAQQKENRDTDGSILRGPYETNSFWSNWYIGVGGGINIYEGEFDNKTSVGTVSLLHWMCRWASGLLLLTESVCNIRV